METRVTRKQTLHSLTLTHTPIGCCTGNRVYLYMALCCVSQFPLMQHMQGRSSEVQVTGLQRERGGGWERDDPVGVDGAFTDCKKKRKWEKEDNVRKRQREKIQSNQKSHFAVYPALNSALIGPLPATLRVTSRRIGCFWDCGPGRLPDSCLKDINTSSPTALSLSLCSFIAHSLCFSRASLSTVETTRHESVPVVTG